MASRNLLATAVQVDTAHPRHSVKGKMGRSHFAIDPSTIASTSSVKAVPPQPVPFDAVPRNDTFDKLLPIMSRLPLHAGVKEDIDPLVEDQIDEDDETLDYIQGRQEPYTHSRLPTIDLASLELWKALHSFRPVTSDYAVGYLAVAPHPLPADASADKCPAFSQSNAAISVIQRVFNWSSLPPLPSSLETEWYGVIFRSARKTGSESLSFYEADRQAHEEAVDSGGLLMYWYGTPDPVTGENLATCIWTDRSSAIKASKLKKHGHAARYTRDAYSTYELTRYKVKKVAGETTLRIQEWES